MRKIISITLAAIFIFSALAFKALAHYDDIFKQLQMESSEAKESICINFQDGVLDFPYSKVVTKMAIGKREAAVKEIGDFIKAYTESPEFAEKYQAAREEARPKGVESANEKIQARIEQLEKDIEETENEIKKASGDKKQLLILTLKEQKKELAALTHPNDPNHDYYVKKRTQVKAWETEQASEDEKYWLQDYPPTVKKLVKKRITEFLELAKDIDFNAKLVKSGSKMIFANPALEAKSNEWKRCFRCGKETITAARNYAQQWLAAIK